ncbi:MAG: GH39 family glycosyl hydrolase [Thermomicrobiales bacterium]
MQLTHLTRRALLINAAASAVGALLAACGKSAVGGEQQAARDEVTLTVSAQPTQDALFRTSEFSTVGVFDVDWLVDPSFTGLLDNLAASPGAFTAVRFFGALNSGTLEKTTPTESSEFEVRSSKKPDSEHRTSNIELLPATFAALEALTSRGLTPFLQLSFFPPDISPSPTLPPASFDGWQTRVRAFLDALVADPRFGLAAIRTWWFEVWNEPNIPVFWQGTFDRYVDMYRATSDAVRASGYPIRLGGPALAYLPASDGPAAGAPLMRRFLQFLHDEPGVQCDFLSFHEKGTWVNPAQGDVEPALGDLVTAAEETARMALALIPERCNGMTIINNEADMKVGFDIPYEPRMTERFPAWLAGTMIAHDTLTRRYRDSGLRFHAAADDANLQLVQAPFDGRRSLMTRGATTGATGLFKLPVYHFYELLRLLGDRHGTIVTGGEQCYPATDLFHLLTVADEQIGALFSLYPTESGQQAAGSSSPTQQSRMVDYTMHDIPWQTVNIARFQIDATHSNAYTAAGARLSLPDPDPATARTIRQAQELALFAPIQQGVALADGTFRDRFAIAPFTTLLYWITPYSPTVPPAPRWFTATAEDGNAILRWEPNRDPSFFSYEVALLSDGAPPVVISPTPLRSALWVDTAPPAGPRRYAVRTISASGITGEGLRTED